MGVHQIAELIEHDLKKKRKKKKRDFRIETKMKKGQERFTFWMTFFLLRPTACSWAFIFCLMFSRSLTTSATLTSAEMRALLMSLSIAAICYIWQGGGGRQGGRQSGDGGWCVGGWHQQEEYRGVELRKRQRISNENRAYLFINDRGIGEILQSRRQFFSKISQNHF